MAFPDKNSSQLLWIWLKPALVSQSLNGFIQNKAIFGLKFQCCGVDTANEYDTSLWVLQSLGPPLVVPLSCCKLTNPNETKAYLNPHPINKTLCQALEKNRHEDYRHTVVRGFCRISRHYCDRKNFLILYFMAIRHAFRPLFS